MQVVKVPAGTPFPWSCLYTRTRLTEPGTLSVYQPCVFKSGLVAGLYWNPKASSAQLTEHGFFATAIHDVVIHLTVLHAAWLALGF